MTVWNEIYNKYQSDGTKWATLEENVDPLFIQLLNDNDFKLKSALDIGCGTGKYLKILQDFGFRVSGVDNSETAVEMTLELLGNEADVVLADMYELVMPENNYDLILSISTLHHGTKGQIANLIDSIFQSLAAGGYIFITLPDYEYAKLHDLFKNQAVVEPGTFVPLTGPEKGLPHSFFGEKETRSLFSDFAGVKISLDNIGRWFVVAQKK